MVSHNETECQPEECQRCCCLPTCTAAQAAYVRLYADYDVGPVEALVMAVAGGESPQEWLDRIGRSCT